MAFSESLTVRILGDSSGLRREIADVISEIANLQERLRGVSSSGDQLGRSVGNISAAIRPLQQVSQFLSRITQQVQALSQTPVSLNVQPALQALQQLMNAAQAAAGVLRLLSVGPVAPAGPQPQPAAEGLDGNPRRMASGGLVTGQPGLDRIPAMLSAGEYVLNRGAVESLGTRLLDSMNLQTRRVLPDSLSAPLPSQPPARLSVVSSGVRDRPRSVVPPAAVLAVPDPPRSPGAPTSTHPATVNHFGGITIQVRETADVNSLVRDLRLQGITLRNRRG
jgi:hypothetical protein